MEMSKVVTYEKAKQQALALTHYIELIDTFNIQSLKDLIIHQYAIHNSISKVIKSIHNNNMDFDTINLNHDLVRETILSKPTNELHSIIAKDYKIKTRPQRRSR